MPVYVIGLRIRRSRCDLFRRAAGYVDPEGTKARRDADPVADQIRAGGQSEDGARWG